MTARVIGSFPLTLLLFALCRGAHAKVQQLLQKYGLREGDLPPANASGDGMIINSEALLSISVGSTVGGSLSDDVSALTPIPENRAVQVANRWETDGTARKDVLSAPPRPPRRPSFNVAS